MMHRRRFLSLGLEALLAGALLPPARNAGAQPAPAKLPVLGRLGGRALGRVVQVGGLIPPGRMIASSSDALPAERVAERLESGMRALLGPEPWAQIFGAADCVALKINGLAAGRLSPRPELVEAIVAGLLRAGVKPGRVIVWDRTTREVERSGFPLQTGADAVRHYGTDALRDGYGRELESCGSVGSLVTRILSEYATALVNVGVLKDHDLAGISAGMKNLYGAIHNPNRYHDHGCDPFVAEVTALPAIRERLRLTVIDAVLGQAEAGPAFAPGWIWPCDRILLACDPVAGDQVAWDLIEGERARRGLPTLAEAGRPPRWIASAARLELGRQAPVETIEV